MSSEITRQDELLAEALAAAGKNEQLRGIMLDALREGELHADNPAVFREHVRWPLILSLLRDVSVHKVVLEDGSIFEVAPDSRIEKALLLSTVAHPDHVWEPQTTKLLTALAIEAMNVIVGGAYIGDQVVLIARAITRLKRPGIIHAFEPMKYAFDRLVHHLRINDIDNVIANRVGLWRESDVNLRLDGHLALASSTPAERPGSDTTASVSIDDYVRSGQLKSVELIVLDNEGGEENALHGGQETIARNSPNIVFEIHRNFVDWSDGLEKTSIVTFLTSQGYDVFAIRDFHNNYPMANCAIEIIPASKVYLDGPPHGFNVLATKDPNLIHRLGLKIVANVSPKLLLEKDPALHFPLSTNS
jgi:FkbM family methyltransferase